MTSARRLSRRQQQALTRAAALRPWSEVARMFNAKHGTTLTRGRMAQIGEQAERKLKQLLKVNEE